ncbi:hypothetical protein BGZ96_010115 [Linnemannia gamsii]|uniref:F-box domain-containing protein n=1 Tax=Linnemannia gamsii TaxID=64522 RepID=A0ABQ7JVZ9_9FUNG|nr:hypothetical protein BGZ96_010115 [Linnemannia gamsii]
MTQLSIFEIPLIIDAICDNLSADDIFSCRKTTTYDLESTILPVLPELTCLTRIEITMETIFSSDLLVGIFDALPDSVRILEIDYEDWRINPAEETVYTWKPKPNKLERICIRGDDESSGEDLYLIPLIKVSPELQALRVPSVSGDHVESFMRALGESCPKLRYLVLNKHKADHSYGNEAYLFEHIRQPLKMLRIDLAMDRYGDSSIVLSTLMKHSADSLQELRLHNVDGLPIEFLEDMVEKCPNLKVIYHRDNYSYQCSNMMIGRGWKPPS